MHRFIPWRARVIVLALAFVSVCATRVSASDGVAAGWEEWQRLQGVLDLGLRSDGSLVAVAEGRLSLVARDGTVTPFARGQDGFLGSVDGEPYLVVSPGLTSGSAGCEFGRDEVYVLDLGSPPGIVRVDIAGRATTLAALPQVNFLGGIAFDNVGRFDYRLLVEGTGENRTWIFAIDCLGNVTTITDSAPTMEGGFAVAPLEFGTFGGDLLATDELSGQVWAIAADGSARLVATPNLPTGGDTGVESLGFVPPGFMAGGSAYLADRGVTNNPFPGTDSILRLGSDVLAAAGVQDGDLLVSTEGGGTTVLIRCGATCVTLPVADGPQGGNVGHIEGHIIFISDGPPILTT